jgi:hypothetical protein
MHFVHITIIKNRTKSILPPIGAKQLILHRGTVLLAHSSKGKKVEEEPKRTIFHVGTPLPVSREVSDPRDPNDSAYGTPLTTKKW